MTDADTAPTPQTSHPREPEGIDVRLSTIRWTLSLTSLLVAGPIAAGLVAGVRGPDGGPEASLFTGESLGPGLIALVVSFALAAVLGVVSARFAGPRSGLRNAGFVIAWASFATGEVDRIIIIADSAGPFRAIAVEGVVVGLLGLVLCGLILLASRPTAHVELRDFGDGDTKPWQGSLSLAGLVAFAASAIIAVVVGGYLAFDESMRGQAILAACVGGLLAGLVGRLAGSAIDASGPPPALACMAGLLAAGVIAPWLPGFMTGDSNAIVEAARSGTLPSAAHVLPLDWLAGTLIGVQIGMVWAGGSLEQQQHKS